MPGVISVTPETEDLLFIKFDPELISARLLSYIVEDRLRCPVKLFQDSTNSLDLVEKHKQYMNSWVKEFTWSLVFTVPIFIMSMIVAAVISPEDLASVQVIGNLPLFNLIAWVLAFPVQFYFGKRFYKGAYKAIRNKSTNMDVLIVLGTSSAFFYGSIMNFLFICGYSENDPMMYIEPSHSFETSSLLISIVLLGKYLEAKSKHRTTDAVTSLAKLKISHAVCVEQGVERNTDVDLLEPGCIVKVYPGASIPADGFVVEGEAWVNESMMTGEGNLVKKTLDMFVFGGTICSKGTINVKVSKVGQNTALAQIIQLVESAQSTKPPIQAVADRISSYFVPLVLLFACTTWAIWFGLIYGGNSKVNGIISDESQSKFIFGFNFGISVLVIACPCALGLATPTAVMVATGVAARFGILIKGGEVLEAASNIKTVVFDKTGTLTQGKLKLKNLCYFSETYSNSEIGSFILSVESKSEHLIAKSICSHITEPILPCQKFENIEGQGVTGTVRWKERDFRVSIGNPKMFTSINTQQNKDAYTKFTELENEGKTVLYVGINNQIVAVIAVSESELVKPEAPSVIKALKDQGLDVWIITGDNKKSALKVAECLKIPEDRIIANCYPGDKRAKVEYLQGLNKYDVLNTTSGSTNDSNFFLKQSENNGVMFVGDGINDSPSLAQADIGIAIGGTDIANEAAGVVLLKSDLRDVLTTYDLSKKTLRKIKWNFFWAFLYNICGIPLAGGILYIWTDIHITSVMAAAAMACSSTAVVLSSLLLNRYHPLV